MLNITNRFKKANRIFIALLFSISFITLHSNVFADIKQSAAEEYRVKGYEEQQKGNYGEALNYYSKAIALGLENAVVYNDIGVLYEQTDFLARAEQFYLKAISVDKSYLPPYINLAYFYMQQKQMAKAAQYFRLRYELGGPGDPWAQKAKEELLKIRPEYRQWIVEIEAQHLNQQLERRAHDEFAERIKRANEHYERGQRYLENGEFRQAIMEFETALRFTPQNPKIAKARKEAILEMTKKDVQHHSDQAIRMLESGNSISAKYELQKMLTTFPNETGSISR